MEQTCAAKYDANLTTFLNHAEEDSLSKNDSCFMGCILFELNCVMWFIVKQSCIIQSQSHFVSISKGG